ncbi:MAG: 2Fe-2S ferredoxin [Verrucomicrobiales bacterium]|nr:2Fe-2S ferredoxin [Verrucomicrobiales bacterium]MDB6131512.1 2Fe-2S ferredoxin [Verrucomicrobiales bacterium]
MNTEQPDFQKVYPIRLDDEEKLTKKQFIFAFVFSVLALLAGSNLVKKWWPEKYASIRFRLPFKASRISVGSSVQFQIPEGKTPILVTRISDQKFVAYCQKCTHLSCPVHYLHDKKQFLCPCHEGVFDAESGRPLAGPPREPLKRYEVEVIQDEIFIKSA